MFDARRLFAALQGKPGPQNAFERGVVALDAGLYDVAASEFAAALAKAEGPAERAAIHNKRGVSFVASARREEALEAFCEALADDERCAPALVNVGNLMFEDGHVLDAIDYYRAAIAADEAYATAHRNLGIAFKRLGRRSESVRALKLADRLASRFGRRRA